MGPSNTICLEPEVMDALVRYRDRAIQFYDAQRSKNRVDKKPEKSKKTTMNNIDQLLQKLDEDEKNIAKKRAMIIALKAKLDGFDKPLSLSFDYMGDGVNFDYPGRAETVALITHLHAGKWDRVPSFAEGKLDYTNKTLLPMRLRIYAAEPPANCKIVEVPVEIPAQPARVEMRKTVVCKNKD